MRLEAAQGLTSMQTQMPPQLRLTIPRLPSPPPMPPPLGYDIMPRPIFPSSGEQRQRPRLNRSATGGPYGGASGSGKMDVGSLMDTSVSPRRPALRSPASGSSGDRSWHTAGGEVDMAPSGSSRETSLSVASPVASGLVGAAQPDAAPSGGSMWPPFGGADDRYGPR